MASNKKKTKKTNSQSTAAKSTTAKKKVVKKTAVKKAAIKKSVVKKTAVKKSATKKAAKKKVVKKKASNLQSAKNKIKVTMEQRHKMICEAAYYISLDRTYETVNPTDDWLQAENFIDQICTVHNK